jgi:hypothetical protein
MVDIQIGTVPPLSIVYAPHGRNAQQMADHSLLDILRSNVTVSEMNWQVKH